jgi:hypothetical protein
MAALTVFSGDTTPSATDLDANFNLLAAGLGARNRLINGCFRSDQRNGGAAQTISAGALTYTADRWFVFGTGASVTGQLVAGPAGEPWVYRITGAASVSAVAFGQRIEAHNSADLAGTTATLSVKLSNSLLTTVAWTARYATAYNNFTTRTAFASGSFTVNSTLTRYQAQIAVPAAATTGIEIEFSVGAQVSGTWQIGAVQFEAGTMMTPFERRPFAAELAMCQRYFEIGTARVVTFTSGSGATPAPGLFFSATKRATPVMATVGTPGYANASAVTYNGAWPLGCGVDLTVTAAGVAYAILQFSASAEL